MQAATDNARRVLLRRLTMGMFLIGIIVLAIPFTSSLKTGPDASLPIMQVDVADMRPAELRALLWNGWPVYILKRSPQMLTSLREPDARLLDPRSRASKQPDTMQNSYRSASPEYLVVYLGCESLRCPVAYKDAQDMQGDYPQGALVCTCGGSVYDFAGRVYQGMPDEKNLAVPEYAINPDGVLRLGDTD